MEVLTSFFGWSINNLDEELNNFKRKMEHLEAIRSDKHTDVENEEIQPGKKRKSELVLWFKRVDEMKSEWKSIETEFREQGPSGNLKSRIEKKTKEVENLIQQGRFPKGVVLDDHASTRLPKVTTDLVGENVLENIESIIRRLKQEDVFAIGIYGMGGVGKSTLVKHVHNKLLKDADIGGQVYWVTASRECSLEKLQIDIGKALGLSDLSKVDEMKNSSSIYARFSRLGKSVLIVDDLWKSYRLEQIGIPESCGCKLVLTTRLSNVCQEMGCKISLKIEPLSKPHAWKLFIEKLGSVPSEVPAAVAEEIVKECGGLPLALTTMGCCMRGMVDAHDWKNALNNLKMPLSGQGVMDDDVFRVLKFSFDNLKDDKVQNCFLSCVLFPEDYEVSREYLVDLWIYEGSFDEIENWEGKVNKGNAILNTLEKACLLESSTNCFDIRSVKMHDLIRDMAIIITQKHPRFMAKSRVKLETVPQEEQWSKDLVKVSLSYNNIKEIPSGMAPMTMKLSVLLLNDNRSLVEIPESFFVHMKALKILDISETNIDRLPDSVCNLENLRALFLNGCEMLTYVPSLAKLINLMVLDLRGTRIERLTDSVSNLENLRALLLSNCEELTYVPSLVKLTKLRVLDLEWSIEVECLRGLENLKSLEKVTYWPWNVSDIKGFNRFIDSSRSLTHYRFFLKSSVKLDMCPLYVHFWEEFCDRERAVMIGKAVFGEKETLALPATTIEVLIIIECEMKGRELGDVFPSLSGATSLQNIIIDEFRGLEYLVSSSSRPQEGCSIYPLFDTLDSLGLYRLPDLTRIIEYEVSCSFSHLGCLNITQCPKLKVVFPFNMESNLPNMKYISVCDCEEVEVIFESNKGNESNPILAPNLSLELLYLPKLSSIYGGLLLCDITWEACPKLKLLRLSNKFVCAASLRTPASIFKNQGFWETLQSYDPQHVCDLKNHLNQTSLDDDDVDDDDDDDDDDLNQTSLDDDDDDDDDEKDFVNDEDDKSK